MSSNSSSTNSSDFDCCSIENHRRRTIDFHNESNKITTNQQSIKSIESIQRESANDNLNGSIATNEPAKKRSFIVKVINRVIKKCKKFTRDENLIEKFSNLNLNESDHLDYHDDQDVQSSDASSGEDEIDNSTQQLEYLKSYQDNHLNGSFVDSSQEENKLTKIVRVLNSVNLKRIQNQSTQIIQPQYNVLIQNQLQLSVNLAQSITSQTTDSNSQLDVSQLVNNLKKLNLGDQSNQIVNETKENDLSVQPYIKQIADQLQSQRENEDIEFSIPDYSKFSIEVVEGECHYCSLNDPRFVVKCLECGICFCDKLTNKYNTPSSHIMYHLTISGHRTIDFKLQRNIGNPKGCNICNSSNIFNLGYISSNENHRYLICRPPCSRIIEEYVSSKKTSTEKPIHKDFVQYFADLQEKLPHLFITGKNKLNSDSTDEPFCFKTFNQTETANIGNWKPLIDSTKHLIDYVISRTNHFETLECKDMTIEAIEEIENKLKAVRLSEKKNKFDISDANLISFDQKVCDTPAQLIYENGTEYRSTFYELMKLELATGQLEKDEKDLGTKVVFERMCKALNCFSTNDSKVNQEIYDTILGKKRIPIQNVDETLANPDEFVAPNLVKLNQSQANSLYHCLHNPMTLIQGPPGTGKTHLAGVLIYNLFENLASLSDSRKKILVCAPSNKASDHLASKIKQTGLKVIRVLSVTKEKDENYHSPLSVHHRLNKPNINDQNESELASFMENVCKRGSSRFDVITLKKLRKKLFNHILAESQVIVVTCCSSADHRLKDLKFEYLIVDEVSLATEPEILIPLNSFQSIQKLILIGDIQQLSPVIKNKTASQAGLNQSLFQRLITLGNKSFMLNQQYRMHPFIAKFSSFKFYNGLLKNGITEEDRVLSNTTFKFPDPSKPVMFLCCQDAEQTSSTGHSYLNREECNIIGKIVYKMVGSGIEPQQIGIITAYNGQKDFLRKNLKFFGVDTVDYDSIEIETINAYQGREKDFIILSTVRCNDFRGKKSIGFLSDVRRLNVALTRAKFGLIIVGDHSTLSNNDPVWCDLLRFYRDNSLIFRSLDDVQSFYCWLNTPRQGSQNQISKLESIYHIKLEIDDDENPETRKEILYRVKFFIV